MEMEDKDFEIYFPINEYYFTLNVNMIWREAILSAVYIMVIYGC